MPPATSLRKGALGGVLATAAMTVAFLLGRLLPRVPRVPPEQVMTQAERKLDATRPSGPLFWVRWLVAHFGLGALYGIAYAALRRFLPRSPALAGLVFGAATWVVDYLGVLPLLRLYPSPADESRQRMAVNIVAHAVYGLALSSATEEAPHR